MLPLGSPEQARFLLRLQPPPLVSARTEMFRHLGKSVREWAAGKVRP